MKEPSESGSLPQMDERRIVDEWPEDHDERLIQWMLSLSPEERLATLQSFADGIHEIRNGRRGPLSRTP